MGVGGWGGTRNVQRAPIYIYIIYICYIVFHMIFNVSYILFQVHFRFEHLLSIKWVRLWRLKELRTSNAR